MSDQEVQVLFRREEESWSRFARRVRETEGPLIVVFGAMESALFLREDQRTAFLEECAKLRHRVRLAVRQPLVIAAARKLGIRVFGRARDLRKALLHHPQRDEALRVLSPGLWRQMWRSRLQSAGFLTLPRLRIALLILLSGGLFAFVVFRLLPSADVRVWARGDRAVQTLNILFAQSGASVLPTHIRVQPLVPIEEVLTQSLTFDQISKQFTGTNAEVPMTVVNNTDETLPLKGGTRFRNQAGMIFRSLRSVDVPSHGTMSVLARADVIDAYGEIIGERGNVAAGLQWELPALYADQRKSIHGENRVAAKGGTTSYRKVLRRSDIDLAQERLRRELLAQAKQRVEEKLQSMNMLSGKSLKLLTSDQLVRASFTGVTLPLDLLNQSVPSINVRGTLVYRMFAYDAAAILDIVGAELQSRVAEDKRILPGTVDLNHLDLRIFDYADDLSWIKGTAELTSTEQFILDPLTPSGAQFARTVREKVAGLSRQDAVRIVKNLPEVEKVSIDIWPPWGRVLPSIPSNISIVAEQ